ncbi:MAG: helix-turn-helix domain-containing protein [Petrimonas sp.]|uniref:helix-turn-helix transcriptional regulator n=1 Tax=Petrimonas sp. TaxID=2023866 RepID=UPI00095B67EF|nr:helix-turn-helix domain-containing protein [Petrimonas sp.]MEA5044924.1 helix-turn-helix domain-containing protein [Petrimonas sp.]OJV35599.1 MAG: plasmid maintenance system antidote protein [Bacteroidia bacterium 43-41]
MDSRINILKGIHPGKLIERDLKKQAITQRSLGEETGIPYQTINAIITGKRNLTIGQALKIETALGYEEGFLSILQSYHDIEQYKDKESALLYPEAPKIRKILFWDTDFSGINWGRYKRAVIERVLERGSKEEINEIKKFYNLSASELKQFRPRKSRPAKLMQKTNG